MVYSYVVGVLVLEVIIGKLECVVNILIVYVEGSNGVKVFQCIIIEFVLCQACIKSIEGFDVYIIIFCENEIFWKSWIELM